MEKFRFHVLGVPHTISSPEYNACAYTQKVVKFCKMMSQRGHIIYHYGHEHSQVTCHEHITVVYDKDYKKVYDDRWKSEFFSYDTNDHVYRTFYKNSILEIQKRKKPCDFILPFWGAGVKPICDVHSDLICVEPGIGYASGHWAKYKVFESYAIYHAYCGLSAVGQCKQNWYDVVIPNYFDLNDFQYKEQKDDYFLYLGRVYSGKGVDIAIETCNHLNQKLIIAGQGSLNDFRHLDVGNNIEYIGYADMEKRKELMANAKGVFLPSKYVEPFGGVQVESLLSGTPTITTDWGAFAENNIHGVTGYRCRTFGDFVNAAKNITHILPENCRKQGEKFSLENIAPLYEKYFRDVMDVW
jgi:glycosyltransferase involved in cell wall biosynthesis